MIFMTPPPPAIEVTYIGGPTALIEIGGLRILTDPTFDPAGGEYKSGSVTLKKTQGPAMELKDLGPIDVVLLTHDHHPDNLDSSGRKLLESVPNVLTTESGAQRLKSHAIGMKPWDKKSFQTKSGQILEITATPARHGPAGIEKVIGDVIGFVISSKNTQKDLVYITGDTVWYSGINEVAQKFHPQIVLLFAGAAQTRGPFHLTMNTNEAIELTATFKDSLIVPVHAEGWEHFRQSREDLAAAFKTLGFAERLKLPAPGKKTIFQSPP